MTLDEQDIRLMQEELMQAQKEFSASKTAQYVPRGIWSADVFYMPNDVVYHDGNSYICLNRSKGVLPTNEKDFVIFAGKGGKGDIGIQGEQGERGEQGTRGFTGKQGVQGLQGPQGDKGEKGEKGDKGDRGAKGDKGETGDSAYEAWLKAGNRGTITKFLKSLEGKTTIHQTVVRGAGGGGSGSGSGTVQSVVAGTNITVDNTDPANPVVSATGGGGGGAVDSVNGLTGVVVLDADDIDDAVTAHKFVTSVDVTKLGNLSGTNTGDQDLSGLLPTSYLDTDGALTANSDVKVPSQKAVKTYVDTAVTGLLDFKGSTDASINPNYPSALKGDVYIVTVAGKIGGASGKTVEVGDAYFATANNAGGTEASVGTSWSVLEHNLIGALLTGNNLSDLTSAATARTNLGLAIGTDVQAYGATLTALEALALAQGDLLYATGADAPARLPKGTTLQQLRMNVGATAPEWFTPSASGGQTTYDAIVASSGGDYTTLTAALAAASAGWRILVRDSYSEAGSITSALNNIEICGQGKYGQTITFGANSLTLSGTGVRISNLGFSFSSGLMTLSGANATIDSCAITMTSTAARNITLSGTAGRMINSDIITSTASASSDYFVYSGANYTKIQGCHFIITNLNNSSVTSSFVRFEGLYQSFTHNTVAITTLTGGSYFYSITGNYGTYSDNTFSGTTTAGSTLFALRASYNTFANNTLRWSGPVFDLTVANNAITGNSILVLGLTGSFAIYIDNTNANSNVITGNNIYSNIASGWGIYIGSGNYNVVSGNTIRNFTTGIEVVAGAGHIVTSNQLHNCTTPLTDTGTSTQMNANSPVSLLNTKDVAYMKNTSGATIAAGDLVVYKSVAAGDEVTTTTTAGDAKVIGMCVESTANNAYGHIQRLGKTKIMKVDGTTDIAIGDYISCFTTVGIGQKASAGQVAIAIALEAYTTNNSSGVIDALIIAPKLI